MAPYPISISSGLSITSRYRTPKTALGESTWSSERIRCTILEEQESGVQKTFLIIQRRSRTEAGKDTVSCQAAERFRWGSAPESDHFLSSPRAEYRFVTTHDRKWSEYNVKRIAVDSGILMPTAFVPPRVTTKSTSSSSCTMASVQRRCHGLQCSPSVPGLSTGTPRRCHG
jgi:hypothetical protein